jgi:hypothetical protein
MKMMQYGQKAKKYMKPHNFLQKSVKRQDLKSQKDYKNYKEKAILPTVKLTLEQNVN